MLVKEAKITFVPITTNCMLLQVTMWVLLTSFYLAISDMDQWAEMNTMVYFIKLLMQISEQKHSGAMMT